MASQKIWYIKYRNFWDIKGVYTFFLIKWILSFDYFKYFDKGMSQKDSRDDSKGPASTQKGRTQNAEPYSMEYPMEYLKWSTPKNHVLVK